MNREEAKELAEVMQAYAEGKEIQYKLKSKDVWLDINEPEFFFNIYDFRIKPEAEYRSFKDCDELIETYDKLFREETCLERVGKDLELPLIWVKSKEYGTRHLIISFGMIRELGMEVVEISHMNYSMSELFDCFTFLDGSPCGVAVEEVTNVNC